MAAAMVMIACSGIVYVWSIYQNPIIERFGWDIRSVSLTFTMQVLATTVTPLFIGKYQKTIGVRKYMQIGILIYVTGIASTMLIHFNSIVLLYLTAGLITGVGISMLFPSLMSYGGSLFPERTGIASGMTACTYCGGSIIFAPLAANIIEQYGIIAVFGVFSILFAVIMLPVSFLIKEAPDDFYEYLKKRDFQETKKQTKDYTWREMIRTPRYYLLVMILILGTTAGLMIMGHASGILQEFEGLTPERAAAVVGAISIFNALGRIVFGAISDKLGRYVVILVLFTVIGAAMLFLTKTTGLLFIVLLGSTSLCYGGFVVMVSPLCADHFGIKNLSVNYSFLFIAFAFASVIGPQLAAQSKALGSGYETAFTVVGILAVVGIALTVYLMIKEKERVRD